MVGILAYDRYEVQKVFAKHKNLRPKSGLSLFIGDLIDKAAGISTTGSESDGGDDNAPDDDEASAENNDAYDDAR